MFNKKRILTLFLCLIFCSTFANAKLKEITSEKLQESILNGVQIIDIRTAPEWASTGVVPTSKKLTFFDENGGYDLNDWMNKFQKLVKNKKQPFVLVCRSANRTSTVGTFLSDSLKYENVYHLKGGIKSWISQNREVEK